LINVARPQLIDLFTLSDVIYKYIIASVVLDIIEKEPFDIHKTDLRLQEMINSPNIILTPHIAFYTRENNQRLGEKLIEEIVISTQSH